MLRRSTCNGWRAMSTPSMRNVPDVGSSMRLIIRSVVVLPQPDDPTNTLTVPDGISSVSASTATLPSGKRLVTCSNSITWNTLGGWCAGGGGYGAGVITHLVLFELHETTTDEQAEEMLRRLRELPTLIPGLDDFHPGRDLGIRPGNHQIGLVARFPDTESFVAYATHPVHVAFVAECATPWATRHAMQLDV